jgi:predicted nucleotidyltransferase component of viral defense system
VTLESAVVWREENRDIFAQTIAAAAEQLSIPQLAVEKDYWVCQALRAIEEHAPGETSFKGGTSLEKQRLIERFSEDIDLLVIGAQLTARADMRSGSAAARSAESLSVRVHRGFVQAGGPRSSVTSSAASAMVISMFSSTRC